MQLRTVGVEEEFALLDPETGAPQASAAAVLAADGALVEPGDRVPGDPLRASADGGGTTTVEPEFMRHQVETTTSPCTDLDELSGLLHAARRRAAEAAAAAGSALAAVGTPPVPAEAVYTVKPRYQRMADRFGRVADDGVTCGCHVHVAVADDEEAVAVIDRIRPWLAPLTALSANSPFWRGADTGHQAFRSLIWSRWPSAGPTGLFGDAAGYHGTVSAMLATGTVLDEGMVYFDVRRSQLHPTVEVRVSDVCLEAEEAVLIAALVRALVETAARDRAREVPPDPVRTEVLRLAAWQAARSGLEGPLLMPGVWSPAPAVEVLSALVDHVSPVLSDQGEQDAVRSRLDAVLARGTGAARQREVFGRTGSLAEVARVTRVTVPDPAT